LIALIINAHLKIDEVEVDAEYSFVITLISMPAFFLLGLPNYPSNAPK
jgi:hypothetical protein